MRCEALNCCDLRQNPVRCVKRATEKLGERHVCWTHARAAEHADRLQPLRFVRRRLRADRGSVPPAAATA